MRAAIVDEVITQRVAALPRDHRGYPIPWFVAHIDGKPDFRVIEAGRLVEAVRSGRCWICGQKLGSYRAYTIGPMCSVNRISSEPPQHRDCAIYAARACPFLTNPKQHRRQVGLPEDVKEMAGLPLLRNPGVTLVWVTRSKVKCIQTTDGLLFHVGVPTETLWFCESRPATREEVEASIESGLPALRGPAQREGEKGLSDLHRKVKDAQRFLPEAEPT